MKKISFLVSLITFAFTSTSLIAVEAQIQSDFEKTFKSCQDNIKSVSGFEKKFPEKKPKDTLNWGRADYKATIDQVNKYYNDKFALVGRLMADLDQKTRSNADPDAIKEAKRKIGEELNGVSVGCRNMTTGLKSQIDAQKKPGLLDKLFGKK